MDEGEWVTYPEETQEWKWWLRVAVVYFSMAAAALLRLHYGWE